MACLLAVQLAACEGPLNSPYPASQSTSTIYYSNFGPKPPKHFDPAKSYSSDEYRFLAQIYEPPFDYHYLKRPYKLVPLTAESIPQPVYYDQDGNILPNDPPSAQVDRVEYHIRIKSGINYQPHPCFAKRADGSPRYAGLTMADVDQINDLKDLKETGTRRLLAKDYVTQIARLCDPRIACPIYSTMKPYVVGMDAYRKAVQDKLNKIRADRAAKGGITYDQIRDERLKPIAIDYLSIPLEGVRVLDEQTYVITLKKKYPQMLYWLAMPFFAPVPQEAIDFYNQGPLVERDLTIDRYPVGTGPYRIDTYIPNLEIVLTRNENFHDDFYPLEGDPGDREAGRLKDAGTKIPFIERLVYKLEKESLPSWNKFLQGYYDQSGISHDSFDRAIQFGDQGPQLSDEMRTKGIQLTTSVQPTIYYFAFNMLDATVGGYTPQQQKLRQAISIVIDSEEWIEIFANGRGIAAHGPIPTGVFGMLDGVDGYNPFVYNRDKSPALPERKTLVQAKTLLAEAGYPGGLEPSGKPLTIHFDTAWDSVADIPRLRWLQKKIEALGVRLKTRDTDYSTFRDKVREGNFQMLLWGWNADYPDPENFLFLLYGPNSKKNAGGENAANYDNPEVNRLFEQMENMSNGPVRKQIIDKMVRLIQQDAPWAFVSHPVGYSLTHQWIANRKPNVMSYNTMKFLRIDPTVRRQMRRQWNRPIYWPSIAIVLALIVMTLPAIRVVRRTR